MLLFSFNVLSELRNETGKMGAPNATFMFHKTGVGDCGLTVGTMGFLQTDFRAGQPSLACPKQHRARPSALGSERLDSFLLGEGALNVCF